MKTSGIKRYITFLFLFLAMIATVSPVAASAETRDIYQGENTEANSYNVWGDVIYSYLTDIEDGRLMRVDGRAEKGKIVVEYFDKNYNFLSQKKIITELPIFGGFFSDGNNYYVLTGQKNLDENDNTEVYCITKYDTSWNRTGSCGLYGANTFIPFDAGSARMVKSGKWLLIHTCHEMYKTDDGYHHQANVTIEVDTDQMKVTDSYTDIMNTNLGYVSHSFNQFILTDGNNIVTLDHGDAYPRAIALIKYQSDFTTGSFVPDYFSNPCRLVNMVKISGEIGENYTGYTVGGFAMSSTDYIAVGNSDASSNNYGGENIWVSSISKDLTGSPVMTYLTRNTSSKSEASTPQLVQTGTDSFVVLWDDKDGIKYALLDGHGKMTGSVCFLKKAKLSDCAPIVSDGKIIWYTWSGDEITFTQISTSDLSQASRVVKKSLDTPKVTAKKTSKGIKLSWKAIDGAAKYKVKVRGKTYTVKGTSFTDKNAKNNKITTYKVTAVNGKKTSFAAVVKAKNT